MSPSHIYISYFEKQFKQERINIFMPSGKKRKRKQMKKHKLKKRRKKMRHKKKK
jgi:hypothetical protein